MGRKVDSSSPAQIELAPFCLIWQRQNNLASLYLLLAARPVGCSLVKQLWVNREEPLSPPVTCGCSAHRGAVLVTELQRQNKHMFSVFDNRSLILLAVMSLTDLSQTFSFIQTFSFVINSLSSPVDSAFVKSPT